MKSQMGSLRSIVERNGAKFTSQKRNILQILLESKSHIDAKEIYDLLRDSGIGLATVYRNLEFFTEINIVKKISIEDRNYYEMKIFKKKPLHIHFKCECCGNILDIDGSWDLDYIDLNYRIGKFYDMDIFDADILLRGLCKTCKKINGERGN